MRNFITLAVLAFSLMAEAQGLVFITKDNVNVRKSPSQSGAVIYKARNGMVFEKASSENGWTKVLSPNGTEAWISSQFLDALTPEELKIYKASDLMVSQTEAEEASYEGAYVVTETSSGGNSLSSWIFYGETNGETGPVAACHHNVLTYNDGRMRTNDTYYSGKRNGWYIMLTDVTDYEGKIEYKLDNPILVYPSFSYNRGVFIDTEYIPDNSDTDNWE